LAINFLKSFVKILGKILGSFVMAGLDPAISFYSSPRRKLHLSVMAGLDPAISLPLRRNADVQEVLRTSKAFQDHTVGALNALN
jgi:hypothetical protein